jgi:hypothetical protein
MEPFKRPAALHKIAPWFITAMEAMAAMAVFV